MHYIAVDDAVSRVNRSHDPVSIPCRGPLPPCRLHSCCRARPHCAWLSWLCTFESMFAPHPLSVGLREKSPSPSVGNTCLYYALYALTHALSTRATLPLAWRHAASMGGRKVGSGQTRSAFASIHLRMTRTARINKHECSLHFTGIPIAIHLAFGRWHTSYPVTTTAGT